MPAPTPDRPLDAVREATIDRLIVNYAHGHLSLPAFEGRLDQAFEAGDHATLMALTEDLDVDVDKRYLERKRRELGGRAGSGQTDEGVAWVVNVFGGGDRAGTWTVPGELRMINVFGGGSLDLTDAEFSSATTRIRLLCLFGGAEIFVPEHANTTVQVVCLFGGVGNRAPTNPDPGAPRIIVEGLALFGGAEVKLRRTFKERLREFADDVRDAFAATQPSRRTRGRAPETNGSA